MTPSTPLPPRKNAQGLPPTHLHHLRSLIHQFLSQQLAPPDEGLPGPSNRHRVPDRPLWTPERLAEIEQAVWKIVVKDGENGKDSLLGCDWGEWATGSRLRKKAWEREQSLLERDGHIGQDADHTLDHQSKPGLASRLPMAGLLPSALGSATSTPMKGQRSPSVASSIHSATRTGTPNPIKEQTHSDDPEYSDSELVEWSNLIKGLKGYLPMVVSGQEKWEMLDTSAPLRTPIRELPGAFPQSYSPSTYSNTSYASLATPLPSIPKEPLPPLLKPVICLSFLSSTPTYPSGSVRSQSTLRSAREGSLPADGGSKRIRRDSASASANAVGAGSGSGSGGLGGLGGWFGNKWSEMTIPAEEKVEIDFVGGRFALPRSEGSRVRRSSTIRKKAHEVEGINPGTANSTDEVDEGTVSTDDSQGSGWSGTERGRGEDGTIIKNHSEDIVISGSGSDIPLKAAIRGEVGVVGGTILIRGIKRGEERRGIERVFRAIIYTIQSHTLELSLLDAFSIPRELEPPIPPPLPSKNDTPTKTSKPTRPGLMRAVSSSQGRRGFFAKLGLGPSEPGKGVGRGMWDGLMGKRRASQAAQFAEMDQSEVDEVDDGLRRSSSVSSQSGRKVSSVTLRESPATFLSQPATPHPLQMGGIERHLYLLSDLRRMIHSTTPGLVFPMPGILLRVEEEDRIRREKAGDEIKQEIGGQGGLTHSGTPTRHVSSSLTTTTANTTSTGFGIDGMPLFTTPRSEDVRGRALGYRLGGDLRSGLSSLAINLDGWEGWCRLQKIEYIFWIGVEEVREEDKDIPRRILACTRPTASVHRYYDPTSDTSIEEYLSDLADELGISVDDIPLSGHIKSEEKSGSTSKVTAELDEKEENSTALEKEESADSASQDLDVSGSWEPVCARPECGVAERDHLRIWASGSRRVVGKVSKTTSDPEMMGFTAQVKCDVCGAEGPRSEIRDATSMSWNKFLELIMYSSLLIDSTLCSHASPVASNRTTGSTPLDGCTYILSTPTLSLRLTSENQPVLDTRLPKLQVGPLVAKRKLGSEAAKIAAEVFVSAKTAIDAPPIHDGEGVETSGMRLPGSSVVLKDEEPASVIAYALSSLAYFNELCGGSARSTNASADPDGPSTESPTTSSDPRWNIVVSRRDTPRDIHPLRALTKKRSELSLPTTARLPLSVTPNAPSLELNIQPVTGLTGGRDGGMDDLVKRISRATAKTSSLTTTTPLPRPSSTDPTPATRTGHPSISSVSLSESEVSIDQEKRITPRSNRRAMGEAPPSSYRRTVSSASVNSNNSPRSMTTPIVSGTGTPPRSTWDKENRVILQPTNPNLTPNPNKDVYSDKDREGWGGSVTSSFTSSFNTLLKLGTDVTDSLTARVRSTPGEPSRSLASILNPLHPSDPNPGPEDTRPHIHLDLSHPKYKISCTVYFASAFDTLRRRCAFDRSYVRSLERSVGWIAEGGKSKANFWKTEDGRLVVKTLVTKWNVSDLQALLEIAPAYFEHMSTTHNKATALAKIMGFYTVKIHDVNTNEKRSMDLLVMENLFWKQEIDRTFDLKGIEARRVPKGNSGTTLFDAEWLEGQAACPLFIHPYAKRILLDSLSTDTRFLSNQYIVDYSLLLGLDRTRSELVVGLVDAVGSYGLFKNIESMGKIALSRGREGEVTIIPPDQYRERFENALRSYFTVCPDKWSRSARRTGTCPTDLPAIF